MSDTDTSKSEIPAVADDRVSSVLSELAKLLGHAVPVYRFQLVERSSDGIPLADLGLYDQCIERWRARFPEMSANSKAYGDLEPDDFPCIWATNVGEERKVLLVRGRTSTGMLVEGESADPVELENTFFDAGQFVVLTADTRTVEQRKISSSRTAHEWFEAAVRSHRGIFAEAIGASFLISTIGLAAAMYTMQVYDRVVPTKGYSTLLVLTVGVGIAMILELVSKQVRANMVDRACKAIDQDLSSIFFGKALDIRLDARPKTVGTFASQIRHFESVRNFMTSSTLFLFADVPFALLFILVIWLLAGPVAIVPLVTVPVAFLVGLMFRDPIERLTAEHMEESNRKNGLLIEAVDGIESVKSVNGEWKMLDMWRELTAKIATTDIKMRSLSTLASNLTQTLQQTTYVGMIAVGAYLITVGELTMGALIACSIISGRALSPLAQLPNLIVQWKQAKIALETLDTIMQMPGDREPEVRLAVPDSCNGELSLEKVKFGYDPEHAVLDIPELKIRPGERVAIIGSIGSGKTTTIKILSGLYHPSLGRANLDGLDIKSLAPEFVRQHTGFLPQDVRLFNGTLRDNLTLGIPLPSDSQILEACQLTGLDSVIKAHPKGLELQITEGGRGLSGGQRQLVGLTRMLITQPKVLLLDEPTASLDSQVEQRVLQHLFDRIPKSSTIVVVSHKVAVLPYVSRVIVIDQGRVVVDGPREAVLATLQGKGRAKQTGVSGPASFMGVAPPPGLNKGGQNP